MSCVYKHFTFGPGLCILPCMQSFLVDFVERDDWLDERRRLLRQRAGLTNADTAKVIALWGGGGGQ